MAVEDVVGSLALLGGDLAGDEEEASLQDVIEEENCLDVVAVVVVAGASVLTMLPSRDSSLMDMMIAGG